MAGPDPISMPTLRVIAPKPKMTIYFALLIIALMAMITACVFLYLEINQYAPWGSVKGKFSRIGYGAELICQLDIQRARCLMFDV